MAGRAERNASSMQETDFFNIEDDFFINRINVFLHAMDRSNL